MITKEEIEKSVEVALGETDYFLVEVKVAAGNKISVYIDSDEGVSIDACARISKHIEADFDRDVEDFELQVSSPGLGQPFKVLKQYIKNIGKDVRVILKDGATFDGKIDKVENDTLVLQSVLLEKQPGQKKKVEKITTETFAMDDIASAKLIISF